MNEFDKQLKGLLIELNWFETQIIECFQSYFKEKEDATEKEIMAPPAIGTDSYYGQLVDYYQMTYAERMVLMLALAPRLKPQVLDMFFIRNSNFDRPFTEFGGKQTNTSQGFIPTLETALFILAGDDINLRVSMINLFRYNHFFFQHGILEPVKETSDVVAITDEYFHLLTTGNSFDPEFSSSFPAKRITTPLEWADLILNDYVMDGVQLINEWIENKALIMEEWGLKKFIAPGFRALFYGPSGTGKTLTATLLGKASDMPVFRVDLSMVVSKYIGETEKNLARVFDMAEHRNWILFFDEADAIFGKRTQTTDAKDRYANQEISYLLQRIESYNGLVILASNLKGNIDPAFSRRFQTILHFPMPEASARLKIWENAFSYTGLLSKDVDLKEVAEKYVLSGGAIMNVLQYCAIRAAAKEKPSVDRKDLLNGIQRELLKEGKIL